MPFKSKKQRKWMHANHPAMADRWEKESPKGVIPGDARQRAAKDMLKKGKPEL